jgi:hypothetical protein
MTPNAHLIPLLTRLYLAYPEKDHDPATVTLYLDSLADIPAWLLERAVQRHIETSEWFPKISDLRQLAARLAGTCQFEQLAPFPVDRLTAAAQALEDAFFHEGRLDPAEWEQLAGQFERLDRPHRADHTRDKLRRLQLVREHQTQAATPQTFPPPLAASKAPRSDPGLLDRPSPRTTAAPPAMAITRSPPSSDTPPRS